MALCSIRSPLCPTRLPISGLALGAGFALAGALLGQLWQPRQEGPPCNTCNGAGYVDCTCQRWLSADLRMRGCDSCRGSLRMRCPGCRGGGMGIPSLLPIPIRIRDEIRALFWGVAIGGFGSGGPGRQGWGRRKVDGLVSRVAAVGGGRGERERKSFGRGVC